MLKCTNSICNEEATRVMALPPQAVPCVYVALYCDEHAQEVIDLGGWAASGPALSSAVADIKGIR